MNITKFQVIGIIVIFLLLSFSSLARATDLGTFIGMLIGNVLVATVLVKVIAGVFNYTYSWIYNNLISPEEFE